MDAYNQCLTALSHGQSGSSEMVEMAMFCSKVYVMHVDHYMDAHHSYSVQLTHANYPRGESWAQWRLTKLVTTTTLSLQDIQDATWKSPMT